MINKIKQEILKDIEFYKNKSDDHYDFWNEHIKYVYNEAINLSELYKADRTIVELGALLHDIALIRQAGDRKDHHTNGAKLARDILEKYNCPKEIMDRVIGCVLNHRSCKNATNIEELCVCDADILAHFDNIPMLFNSAFNRNNVKLNEVRAWMKECFEKDYNDLSDNTRELFKSKYKEICEIVLGEQILIGGKNMKEYSYNIINDVYNWMISGKKNIEVRILKEKSEAIRVGDIITFNNQDTIGKYVKVKISNKTIVNNVYELTEKFEIERMMPGHSKEELIELMKNIYGEELNQKQIVALEFEYISCDSDVEIIEYDENYLEDVKDLLVELEEYIISIDKDKLDQIHPEYREKIAILDLEEVNNYDGKCYLAIENDKAVGLIMGCIPPYDEYDYLDYKCPKRGEITELIVTNKTRSKGIGQLLIEKMEKYFKSVGCEYIIVDVFAYNEIGINFYNKKGYHSRMETMIKKI